MTYDPLLDPYRTDETALRKVLAVGTKLPGGLTIIAQGRYSRGGVGCYAGLTVACHREDAPFRNAPYSTHQAFLAAEGNGPGQPGSQSGHYDMTCSEALKDLEKR